MSVLVLNAGSSSLKYAVVDPETGERELQGTAERLGTQAATVAVRSSSKKETLPLPLCDQASPLAAMIEELVKACRSG
jgi:acetate kinase